jgi:hypothetical protein
MRNAPIPIFFALWDLDTITLDAMVDFARN